MMMRRRTGLFTADQVDGDSGTGLTPAHLGKQDGILLAVSSIEEYDVVGVGFSVECGETTELRAKNQVVSSKSPPPICSFCASVSL